MKDQKSINTVRSYLQRHFPECEIHDHYDFDRHAQSFRFTHIDTTHLVTVAYEFLEDRVASQIPDLLQRFALADAVRMAGSARVIVTKGGIRVEK